MNHDEADTRPTALYRHDQAGLWDAVDVARYLKASRSWVYHQAEAGQLPCVRVGGLLRFDPEAIKRLGRGARS
jgi:excisionase family DNA binding protein